jgi:hypothetical protein
MTGFQQFGFGRDDGNIGQKNNKFKAEQGRTYRISFAWWSGLDEDKLEFDSPTPEFVGALRHYKEGVGYILNKGPEYTKLLGPPKQSIGTIIIVWPTDSKGEPDKTRLGAGDFDVMPWIFSGDKYKQFAQIHSEFHVGQHDVKATCTDTQYQKMTFAPCKESILRKLLSTPKTAEKFKDEIIARVKDIASSIQNDIAREATLDEIREKLSGSPSGGGGGFTQSGPGSEAVAEDIDDLVDGLLT